MAEDDLTIVRAPLSVVGYHGCHAKVAHQLLDGEPFRMSGNEYDWLGSGVYFWEHAPFRAKEWAQQKFGENWAVLKAEIVLGDCLNLLDTDYFADLRSMFLDIISTFRIAGRKLPENHRGANRLDKVVIDELCELYQTRGAYFDTVRGCFPEGDPIYEGSKLLSQTHIQIAVRNPACIYDLELVNYL